MAAGGSLREVFVGLLADGVEPGEAAVAVCVAAGSTRQEALRRLGALEGLWELVEAGEEGDAIDVLIGQGYFEPDAVLDQRQQVILAHLQAALQASGGVASGMAVGLATDLRTGRLAEAFLRMEHLPPRPGTDSARFWAAMCHAGEMLAVGHGEVQEALGRCRQNATAS
jgi:hypothetical protein